jgi:four helix bundle protein
MKMAYDKSRKFSVRIYRLYKYLCEEKNEFALANRILRSGTLIGSNLAKARCLTGKKETLAKTKISLKECAETEYWLYLLKETNLLSGEFEDLQSDCGELLRRILFVIKKLKTKDNHHLITSSEVYSL